MKEFGPPGGCMSLVPPLDLPMVMSYREGQFHIKQTPTHPTPWTPPHPVTDSGYCSDQATWRVLMAGLERGSLWGRLIVRRQLLLWWWWLNSPWAPGHICGVSVMLMFVVVLLFLVLVQGLTKVRDQSRALEDRNDSNNSLEVYTPNSFIHLFYNSPYMNVVDMHNILNIPSDSVLWEKTMEASYLVGSFPCQFNFKSVFDIPVWDGVWEQATFGHFCPSQ